MRPKDTMSSSPEPTPTGSSFFEFFSFFKRPTAQNKDDKKKSDRRSIDRDYMLQLIRDRVSGGSGQNRS